VKWCTCRVTVRRRRRTPLVRNAIALSIAVLLTACPDGSSVDDATSPTDTGGDGDGDGDGDPTTDTGDGDGDPTTDTGEDELPPTEAAQLEAWLEAGGYLGWTAESAVHESTGPHFGGVRTFMNAALLGSLESGTGHPAGAATVKELYGDGDTVRGWSVMVKLQADSAGGDGWYWYERYDASVYANGTGEGLCTGCHVDGNDYVLSPYPLQ
jgi:hypothetical protein